MFISKEVPISKKTFTSKTVFRSVLALCLLSVSSLTLAQDVVGLSGSTSASYMVKVFTGLFVVVGLIFAIAWLVKRFGPGTFLSGAQMKIISSMSLGTREKVVVVEIGERQLLLGVTQHSIQTLHKFETPLPINGKSMDRKSRNGTPEKERVIARRIEDDKSRDGTNHDAQRGYGSIENDKQQNGSMDDDDDGFDFRHKLQEILSRNYLRGPSW